MFAAASRLMPLTVKFCRQVVPPVIATLIAAGLIQAYNRTFSSHVTQPRLSALHAEEGPPAAPITTVGMTKPPSPPTPPVTETITIHEEVIVPERLTDKDAREEASKDQTIRLASEPTSAPAPTPVKTASPAPRAEPKFEPRRRAASRCGGRVATACRAGTRAGDRGGAAAGRGSAGERACRCRDAARTGARPAAVSAARDHGHAATSAARHHGCAADRDGAGSPERAAGRGSAGSAGAAARRDGNVRSRAQAVDLVRACARIRREDRAGGQRYPAEYQAASGALDGAIHLRRALAPDIRCNVRRCMLSRRAVSETLRLHSS